MKTVKTARGRVIDMSALVAKHEKTRAVSNVPVNARGDIIDSRGEVKVTKSEINNEYYKNNVPNSDLTEEGIKEEPVVESDQTESDDPIEVGRELRTRDDGTQYYEIEYSDGSMEEQNVEE